ncbi:unnamed protein product [Ectocarpus sp. CCAP 1310/34]|nr:unnamed protein product [Ectocarpus sp. CCAP 1310/34]
MSLAVNIASKLRPEDVPKELWLMLMTTDNLRVSACNPQPGDDLSTSCDEALELPQVREAQHPLTPTDVSNVFLAADSLLSQAFVADMTSAGAITASGRGAAPHEENGEPALGDSYRELGGGGVMEEGGKQVRSAGVACDDEELANRLHREPDVPPTGPAMKRFAREALPEMTSLAKTLERWVTVTWPSTAARAHCFRGWIGDEQVGSSLLAQAQTSPKHHVALAPPRFEQALVYGSFTMVAMVG